MKSAALVAAVLTLSGGCSSSSVPLKSVRNDPDHVHAVFPDGSMLRWEKDGGAIEWTLPPDSAPPAATPTPTP